LLAIGREESIKLDRDIGRNIKFRRHAANSRYGGSLILVLKVRSGFQVRHANDKNHASGDRRKPEAT
jgi:hypothetical protein